MPLLFSETIFHAKHRIVANPLGDRSDHLFAGEMTAIEVVETSLEEVAGGYVNGERNLAARVETGTSNRVHSQIQHGAHRLERRRQAALVRDEHPHGISLKA